MSAFAKHPNDFLDFCKNRLTVAAPDTFISRKTYGEYLTTRLNEAEKRSVPGVHLRRITAEVCALHPRPEGARVELSSGEFLEVQQVVLAFGHFSPSDPPCIIPARETGRYMQDPWVETPHERYCQDSPVLLIGAGLTALDMVLTLLQQGQRGPIYMVSRRGLPLLAHRTQRSSYSPPPELLQKLLDGPPKIRQYLREIRRQVRDCESSGHDWRDVMGALRPITPLLWKRLSLTERARFLRHAQPYWDVHRHRAAPHSYQRFAEAKAKGLVVQTAARIGKITPTAAGLKIDLHMRGGREIKQIEASRVINCTGPNGDLSHVNDSLIAQLHSDGWIQLDPLGLGLRVNDQYAMYDANGTPLNWLSYVGPMLKADFWEAIAVPELRVHAMGLASRLAETTK